MVRVGRHLLAGTYLTAYRTALAVAPALYRDSKRKGSCRIQRARRAARSSVRGWEARSRTETRRVFPFTTPVDLSYFRRKSNPADAVLVDKDQPRPDSDPPYIIVARIQVVKGRTKLTWNADSGVTEADFMEWAKTHR